MRTIITKSAKETQKLAEEIAGETVKLSASNASRSNASGLNCNVICLYGDLGSGKTTFTQGFAKYFGIKKIVSPTFVIMRRYSLKESRIKNQELRINYLYHIDLYRLESVGDVKAVGIEEIISDKNNIVVIEWPERMKEILPEKRIDIYFKYIDDKKREITIFM